MLTRAKRNFNYGINDYRVIPEYRIQKGQQYGRVYYYKMNVKRHNSKTTESRQRARTKVLVRLGNKCVRCGFDDPRALQIDHINGDAPSDPNSRPQRGGMLIFRLLKMSDEELRSKYQLLCANCNWVKREENKEYAEKHPVSH